MVNNPDKGNQNAFPAPGIWRNPISYNGKEVAWGTFSGAPGSPSGFAAIFLAKRDPATGWHSQAIGPKSAEEMIGGGDLFYAVSAASKTSAPTWSLRKQVSSTQTIPMST